MQNATYTEWLNSVPCSDPLYAELLSVRNDPKETEDRFYRGLAFGTGGLRGILGAGTNRMNIYTVGRATFGLAGYLLKHCENPSAVIAYDSRHMSKEFAFTAANILSSKGILTHIFDELMPTPVLSFAVRKLGASSGIVITASHNPKEYNGYKVYNEKGCQITDQAAADITAEIEKYGYFTPYTKNEKLIHVLGDEILHAFLDEISRLSLFAHCGTYAPKIVYTPLNGTGNKPVREIFKRMGVTSVTVVPEQEQPDGNFTTCPYPNPEEKQALSLAISLAEKEGAELVLATDPDADRVGIAVRDQGGKFRLFSGNETGTLLEYYLLSKKKEQGTLPHCPVIVKTIVTTDMATAIARSYGAATKEVLTGFKYIGETIDRLPHQEDFVMGMEESYGYLLGRHARDKDAVSAAMMIVEMAAYFRSVGKSLIDILNELYSEYGYYSTLLFSKTYPGKSGKEEMDNILRSIREKPWKEIGGKTVLTVKDYLQGIDDLPKSNVLSFIGDGFKVIIRPSGTEPKLKLYFLTKGSDENNAKDFTDTLCAAVIKMI